MDAHLKPHLLGEKPHDLSLQAIKGVDEEGLFCLKSLVIEEKNLKYASYTYGLMGSNTIIVYEGVVIATLLTLVSGGERSATCHYWYFSKTNSRLHSALR